MARKNKDYEVLIVHPSGNYNKNAAWSIPKGKLDDGETTEEAARRETWEETGVIAPEELESLGEITYKSKKKKVHCYCGELPDSTVPYCASWEVDKAEFVPLDKAEELLHKDQSEFIKRFRKHMNV
ncbi:MAG: NUDIX domain-containing protein [Crenarchaeota archaeon]|nr:MAG: NUDIX domain-containing protein [Thermoproteota archaeon]